MKPDRSLVRMGCLPSFWANANAVSAVSGSVSSATTISTSFITGTGEKKWTPTTRPGCCTLPASSAIGMDEVFVAITLPGLTSSSSSLISDTFRSRTSGTASITMSAPATSFRSGVNVIRASTSSRPAWSILPCLTAPASDVSTRAWAASRNCGRSRTTTGMPATADTSAMPAPISPPPTTPTELISRPIAAHLRRIGQISCVSSQLRTYRWLPADPLSGGTGLSCADCSRLHRHPDLAARSPPMIHATRPVPRTPAMGTVTTLCAATADSPGGCRADHRRCAPGGAGSVRYPIGTEART